MKFSFEVKIITFFSIVSLGLIFLGILAWQNNQEKNENNRLVQQTNEVLLLSEKVISTMKEFEIGNRGYVITGDSLLLIRYSESKKEINENLENFKKITEKYNIHQSRMDSLLILSKKRIDFSDEVINIRNKEGETAAESKIASLEGESYMNQIRDIINKIETEEKFLLIERILNKNESESIFSKNLFTLLIIAFTLIVLAFLIILMNFRIRKKNELELFIQNEWYNQTLKSLGDGVITTDNKGKITFLNNAAKNLTGWNEEEAKGTHVEEVFDIVNEMTRQKVISPVIEAMTDNKIRFLSNHTILKRKDKSELLIDDSGAPIHNPKGEIIGGVLIFRDITEKKIANDLLLAAEKRFSILFNISTVGTVISSFDNGEFLYVNEAYCKLVGLNSETLKGKRSTDLNIIDSENRKNLMEQILVSNGRVSEIEIQINNERGLQIDVLCSMEKIEIDNQMCLVSFMVDITRRKKAEEQLKNLNENLEERVKEKIKENIGQEKFFKGLLDNLQEGVIILDKNFKVTYLNDAAAKHARRTRQELEGKNFYKIFPGIETTVFFETLLQCMKNGKVEHLENEYFYPDNSSEWFDSIIQPIEQGVLVFSMNITKRKITENYIETQNKELIKKSSELDKFVYSASHDLRAPLASILGLIDITHESLLTEQEEQKEWLFMMKSSVIKLDNFIKEILHYSRNSHMDINKEEIDFNELITEITDHYKFFNNSKKFELIISVAQHEKFLSDKHRISLILNNLISNGFKYQDFSKPRSFLKVSVVTDNHMAEISVEDNGIGILIEEKEKIFEMFYRGTQLSNGSGLGLYILNETLEKLNGKIQVESEINLGSKFSVFIPNLN